MTVHLTPTELGREVGIHRREVLAKCMELGVPIFQGRIDRDRFKHEFFAAIQPDPSTERLLARIRQLEEALREAADDLDKAANQFAALALSTGKADIHNANRFAEKAEQARAALNPDPPDPGTSDSQDTFD